jgi:uncharacterized membrane protein
MATPAPAKAKYPSGRWPVRALLLACALVPLAISVGLTVADCLDLCKGTAGWLLFGFRFQHFGAGFFLLLTVFCLAAWRGETRWAGTAVGTLVSAAAGAEVAFLYFQKFVVKDWCPWCVTIAACVFVAAVIVIRDYFGKIGRGSSMDRKQIPAHALKGIGFVALLLVSTAVTFMGTTFRPPDAAAQEAGAEPWIGNRKSEVTIFVFTDWFCPVCRRVEQELSPAYPELASKYLIQFVDHIVKPESLNYVPYNLAFMVQEKDKYFKIRKKLEELTDKTRSPTQEEVQKAVGPLGVTYRPLPFLEINRSIALFNQLSTAFNVAGTPTVAVSNSKTKKQKILVGSKEISTEKLRAAIEEIGKP